MTRFLQVTLSIPLLVFSTFATAETQVSEGLIGHWPLQRDGKDLSKSGNHGINHGVRFAPTGAVFDGVNDFIEVPDAQSLGLGTSDFSISVWVRTDAPVKDVIGDIVSKFDPTTRTGMNFRVMNSVGATSAQSNHRHLFFGIDSRSEPKWVDRGRPGHNKMTWALTVFDGDLYAGTWEPGEGEAGHVYRHAGGQQWVDLGSPDRCNAVSSLGEHEGQLYAGGSFYSGRGSAQPISPNKHPGGRVFRYDGNDRWIDCGKIGDVYTVTGLVSFGGRLYATTCDSYGCPSRTAACYRYEGGTKWSFVGDAGGRLGAFLVHNGDLYATVFGKHAFARYEGETSWQPLGVAPNTGQTYSAVIYRGRIRLGTWPTGTVFEFAGPNQFHSMGRLGEEKEVMAMAVYNGKLYAGTLPLGKVFRYDEDDWTDTGQLDTTADVLYRRVWSMAVYEGQLFAGTMPAGRVLSMEAGRCVSDGRSLAPGWRHLTAVRSDGALKLFIDATCVAHRADFDAPNPDLDNTRPLLIGFGENDYFQGAMRDLRIYRRALSQSEIQTLSNQAP